MQKHEHLSHSELPNIQLSIAEHFSQRVELHIICIEPFGSLQAEHYQCPKLIIVVPEKWLLYHSSTFLLKIRRQCR